MPTSVTSRNAVITIKDQFGRKLKVINVKQVNEKNGVVKVIKTQKSTSKRTQVDMELKDQIYRYNGKEYTVRIVTCSQMVQKVLFISTTIYFIRSIRSSRGRKNSFTRNCYYWCF